MSSSTPSTDADQATNGISPFGGPVRTAARPGPVTDQPAAPAAGGGPWIPGPPPTGARAAPTGRRLPQPDTAPPSHPARQPPFTHSARPPAGRRAPSAMHVPMRTLGEPPAGLGAPGTAPPPPPAPGVPGPPLGFEPPYGPRYGGVAHPVPTGGAGRYWWLIALVVVVVLGGLGVGAWALLGGGSEPGQRLAAHGLSYAVPQDWTSQAESDLPWVPRPGQDGGIHAEGVGSSPGFRCGTQSQHPRASVGVMQVYQQNNQAPRPQDAVASLGAQVTEFVYGDDSVTTPPTPQALDIDGVPAQTAVFKAGPTGGCGVSGEVTVIALPSPERGPDGEPTLRLFVLQHDTAGGPAAPATLSPRDVSAILNSVRITAR